MVGASVSVCVVLSQMVRWPMETSRRTSVPPGASVEDDGDVGTPAAATATTA